VRKISIAAVLAEVDIRAMTQKPPRATTTMTGSKLLQPRSGGISRSRQPNSCNKGAAESAEVDVQAVRKTSVAASFAGVDVRAVTKKNSKHNNHHDRIQTLATKERRNQQE
jgi:hypothetical protein